MPISQERFMNVVIGTKQIIKTHHAVKELVRQALIVNVSDINSVLTHSTDENAKQVITMLFDSIRNIREHFASLNDGDLEELTAIILAEEIHFKRVGERNRRNRYKQEQVRRDRGAMPRRRELELDTPMIVRRSIPLSPAKADIETDPHFLQVQAELRAKYWPDAAPQAPQVLDSEPKAKVVDRDHERETAENIAAFGPAVTSLDAAAEAELALMRAAAQTAQAQTAQAQAQRKGYEPDVIATSVPPDDVLYAPPLKPGDKLL